MSCAIGVALRLAPSRRDSSALRCCHSSSSSSMIRRSTSYVQGAVARARAGSGPGRDTRAWPRARLSSSSPSRIAVSDERRPDALVVAARARSRSPGTARGRPGSAGGPARAPSSTASCVSGTSSTSRSSSCSVRETPRRISLTGSASAARHDSRGAEPLAAVARGRRPAAGGGASPRAASAPPRRSPGGPAAR